ncbi:MAG: hypothetical protein INH43_22950 [Acidobacteriaceae bacterium]|nr:hypothetical protein [Acidobacteriaceae bacterium]
MAGWSTMIRVVRGGADGAAAEGFERGRRLAPWGELAGWSMMIRVVRGGADGDSAEGVERGRRLAR